MTFKPDLTSFNKVNSGAGTAGFSNMFGMEKDRTRALARTMLWNDKKKEAAKYDAQIAAQMAFPVAPEQGTDWMGIANTVKDSGILSGFGGGLSNSSSIWQGNDLDSGMTYWDTDMPIPGDTGGGNAWWNPFGWGK